MITIEEEMRGLYEGKPIKVRVKGYKKKKEKESWVVKVFPFLKYCYGTYESY